jgi:hypothetical protein
MEKNFDQKSCYYFVWTPLGSRFKDTFSPNSSLVSSLILFQLFANGIVDTGGAR